MGKADFLSPKAIGNRIKSKGLQKLRWYCQMCQKQCRDENGFKCHCMSESHQRQLLLASEDPNQFMDYFSDEFKRDFLELLRRRFGTKRVHNNIVYNEYISHREHIHMNSTQWETLTDFTKWIGKEGMAKVDETPKGWYIQYIDRDPETIRRQEELERKKKQDLDDEERSAKFIEEQVRRGLDGREPEVIAFNMGASSSVAGPSKPSSLLGASALKASMGATAKRKEPSSASESRERKKKSALDEIMEEVRDQYTAVVKLVISGDKLKLDQSHLETVIPAPGKRVMILNGEYRDTEALLEGINEKKFSATLTLDSGRWKGKRVEGIAYEDFCKLA
ncbi:hypothetical protein CRUP_023131 [Coryphaenoides rupestris]|nr:hypothetical protein CRUP_023131 [Coryphaenoides rupestris]